MKPLVAYFSAEYAIADALPTYAGGLGVLAGDTVRQAGADGREFVALGPAYRQNVAVKTNHTEPLDKQMRQYGFELVPGRDGKPLVVNIDFYTWRVQVRAWERKFDSARLLLLDTDFEPNTAINRKLMANLYDPDLRTRLLQQYLLAAAGETVMRELGIRPDVYHLNEGHMAFVILVLAIEYSREHPEAKLAAALEAVGHKVVGTKHTILPGAATLRTWRCWRNCLGEFCGLMDLRRRSCLRRAKCPRNRRHFRRRGCSWRRCGSLMA